MFLLVDKPKGLTSHDVVDRIRGITGERRVGHAGTLDPNATGLLIVGVGRDSTRKLGALAKETTKTYEARIRLGEERDTDDAEGAVLSKARGVLPPKMSEVEQTLEGFRGLQKQVPPTYSAAKIKGKKAYALARSGKDVALKPRKVFIHRLEILRYRYPILEVTAQVSAGTYVRALARDFGRKLGMGAYLSELRRTQIGKYSVEDAVSLERLSRGNWKKLAITLP